MTSPMTWDPSVEKLHHGEFSPLYEYPETQELNELYGELEGVLIGDSITFNPSPTQHTVVDLGSIMPYMGRKPL